MWPTYAQCPGICWGKVLDSVIIDLMYMSMIPFCPKQCSPLLLLFKWVKFLANFLQEEILLMLES